MGVATEIDFSDVKRIKKLTAKFPKEYSEVKFLPLPKNEQTVVEYIKGNLPYYCMTYGGDLISYVPYIGKWMSVAINEIAKYYHVEPKRIL